MCVGDRPPSAPGASSISQWVARSKTYGDDPVEPAAYIRSIDGKDIFVEVVEVDSASKMRNLPTAWSGTNRA